MYGKKEETLQAQAERVYLKCDIKDRTYRFKTYKHCFIGHEAIIQIIALKLASNTAEAMEFGNKLISAHLVRHVENDHKFENEDIYYTFTDQFYKEKKRNTPHLTPYKCVKKVSFMIDASGFNFTPSKSKSAISSNQDEDDKHWSAFGSLSKSEFSYLSERSSFAASLNTLSDTNLWIVDPEQATEQKLDFNKEENSNIVPFAFGGNNNNNKNQIKHNKDNNGSLSGDGVNIPSFHNYISINNRKKSVTSPSFSNRHSKSSHSITFSSTVSLYTETEKRQNSLLFYDLWGVPATRSRANSSQCSGSSEQSQSGYSTNSTQNQYTHQTSTSLSGAPITMTSQYNSYKTHTPSHSGYVSRKQSTMLSGPINENHEEEWSDFDIHQSEDEEEEEEEEEDDDEEEEEEDDNDDDEEEEDEYVEDIETPQTKLRNNKKISRGFKYRKRKSTLTANFIFGATSNNV